jgi:hypothetical protein
LFGERGEFPLLRGEFLQLRGFIMTELTILDPQLFPQFGPYETIGLHIPQQLQFEPLW